MTAHMKQLIEKLYLEGKLKDKYNTPGWVEPSHQPHPPLASAAAQTALAPQAQLAARKRLPRTTPADDQVLERVKMAEEQAVQILKEEKEAQKQRAAEEKAAKQQADRKAFEDAEAARLVPQEQRLEGDSTATFKPVSTAGLEWELPHLLPRPSHIAAKSTPYQCTHCGECFETPLLKRTHAKAGECNTAAMANLACSLCGIQNDCTQCSRCVSVAYCSKDHQREHWTAGHKAECDYLSANEKIGASRERMLAESCSTDAQVARRCMSRCKFVYEDGAQVDGARLAATAGTTLAQAIRGDIPAGFRVQASTAK